MPRVVKIINKPKKPPLDPAEKRAIRLLRRHLTHHQRGTVVRHGWFHVRGGISGKVYRIRARRGAWNVELLDDKKRPTEKICFYAAGRRLDTVSWPDTFYYAQLPLGDHLLAQKITIEVDERSIKKIANSVKVRR